MWEWQGTVAGAVLGALFGLGFNSLKDWLTDRLPSRRGIRIDIAEERGPTSVEYGFTENSVKVTIKNESGEKIEVQDIRLMFARTYGVPVLLEAPPPRSHSQLPAILDSGIAENWHFPAEKIASLIGNLSSKPITKDRVAKIRPQVTTTTGRVYRGPICRFSVDINSHWL